MKAKALNCPNCGAAVVDNSTNCTHCRSRLKTMSCSSCYETIFEGSRFCPLCGGKALEPAKPDPGERSDCPRCRSAMTAIAIGDIHLDECERCGGVWSDVDTFETICAEKEGQAAVLKRLELGDVDRSSDEVRYVPCPACRELMNRSNFARVSGIVIDTCKPHGVWFDSQELPRIIEFIRKGGMDMARRKEKLKIEEERSRLKAEKFKLSVEQHRNDNTSRYGRSTTARTIRDFIDFLID